jgi:hypothetical protein
LSGAYALSEKKFAANTSFGRALMAEVETQDFRVMGHLAGHPNVGEGIIIVIFPHQTGPN